MILQDRIYGTIEIKEPAILELIETLPFQRLKNINQYGGVNFIFPDKYQVSRYEHSIGVWYVLSQLGVNLETQIAGLLHDIGHTAFSHMFDMAMASKSENYHELIASKVKNRKQIEDILKKHRITLKEVDTYPEIKSTLPNIGADRLDYAIRDYVSATNKKLDLGLKVLHNIKLVHRQIVFTNPRVAKEFALTGLEAMKKVIYNPLNIPVYQTLVEIIRQGISESWLTEEIMFEDDMYVLKIIKDNRKRLEEKYYKIFTTPYKVILVSKDKTHDFHFIKLKVRYFDPLVFYNDTPIKLSFIDSEFTKVLKKKIQLFKIAKE